MYKGNEDRFPTRVRKPDGGVWKGNQDSFPVEVTLPDGTVYRGRTPEQRAADEANARKMKFKLINPLPDGTAAIPLEITAPSGRVYRGMICEVPEGTKRKERDRA